MNILFLIILIVAGGSGCVKHTPSPALIECQDRVSALNVDLQQKNDRLKSFNQLNADGSLRAKK